MTVVLLLWMGIAAIPFIYYLIALFSSWRYFRQPDALPDPAYAPPVSILKPIRGLDPDAYENLASFCRQDYPEYEMIFCVDPDDDTVRPVVEKLQRDFPQHEIRVLLGSGRVASNDKVAKLARMAAEARYETVVISDSDVRVRPDYLRAMTAPLARKGRGRGDMFLCPHGPQDVRRPAANHRHDVGFLRGHFSCVAA